MGLASVKNRQLINNILQISHNNLLLETPMKSK